MAEILPCYIDKDFKRAEGMLNALYKIDLSGGKEARDVMRFVYRNMHELDKIDLRVPSLSSILA